MARRSRCAPRRGRGYGRRRMSRGRRTRRVRARTNLPGRAGIRL